MSNDLHRHLYSSSFLPFIIYFPLSIITVLRCLSSGTMIISSLVLSFFKHFVRVRSVGSCLYFIELTVLWFVFFRVEFLYFCVMTSMQRRILVWSVTCNIVQFYSEQVFFYVHQRLFWKVDHAVFSSVSGFQVLINFYLRVLLFVFCIVCSISWQLLLRFLNVLMCVSSLASSFGHPWCGGFCGRCSSHQLS